MTIPPSPISANSPNLQNCLTILRCIVQFPNFRYMLDIKNPIERAIVLRSPPSEELVRIFLQFQTESRDLGDAWYLASKTSQWNIYKILIGRSDLWVLYHNLTRTLPTFALRDRKFKTLDEFIGIELHVRSPGTKFWEAVLEGLERAFRYAISHSHAMSQASLRLSVRNYQTRIRRLLLSFPDTAKFPLLREALASHP